ncbi:hypothetical protein ACRAWD_15105 [Caulobacter segnis]
MQSAFYLGYFFLALPAGLLMRRYGYKAAVIVGLLLFGAGALLFWPAAELRRYELFLSALFVIASGLAFLETSANPLITVLGRSGQGRAAPEPGPGLQSIGLDHRRGRRSPVHPVGRGADQGSIRRHDAGPAVGVPGDRGQVDPAAVPDHRRRGAARWWCW